MGRAFTNTARNRPSYGHEGWPLVTLQGANPGSAFDLQPTEGSENKWPVSEATQTHPSLLGRTQVRVHPDGQAQVDREAAPWVG